MSIQRPTEDQAHQASLADLEDLLVKGDAAVIATDLDGMITHWSVAAERLYGWSGDDAIGSPILDLLVMRRDQALGEDAIDSTLETGGWEGEFEIRCKDGSFMLAFVRGTLIKDDVGRPVGMLGLSMDATAPRAA